jgi:hypothetical protein
MPITTLPGTDQFTAATGTSAAYNSGASLPIPNGVQIKCPAANSGIVYIGLTGVTTSTGIPIGAGESFFVPPKFVANLKDLFFIGSAASQTVAIMVF